jgi:acetyl-CoA C-acetyltransferase
VDKALARSGLALDEISCFDIYSCFPSAVAMARQMTGLKDTDPRPLTLTGGLGFFGGPGSNYSLHAIATLAGAIAAGERENGLITSLGWFMHKHAAGVYSADPGSFLPGTWDLEDDRDPLVGDAPVPVDPTPEGPGIIETYTVDFSDRTAPARGILYGRTGKGLRFIAACDHPDTVEALTRECRVGRELRLVPDPVDGTTRAFLE